MDYFLHNSLCSFFYVALVLVVGSYASNNGVSWGSYWQSALPNTPMSKAVQQLLHPENSIEGKSTYTGVINKNAINPGFKNYGKAASGKIQVEPSVTSYFLEKDLHWGKKMTLHFPKTTNKANLLPRQVANSIPFSSLKIPEILNRFAVKPESPEAEIMKQTIKECEEPSIKGEDKLCATSLESLIDFSVSKLGKQVEVYTTKVEKENKQEYRIERGVQRIGDRSVVCHKQNYVYAVFYCHEVHSTRAYKVPLVGVDGAKAEALAICHTDTSSWNHKHLAFQVLKIKPGTAPICHFLPSGSLVWVPK